MLFNSLSFALFLPIVFFIYWFIFYRSIQLQNLFLLVSSYFFYGFYNWHFVFLLAFSTLLDYYSGLKIYNANTKFKAKAWLYTSVIINLGLLAVFKYYNFFIASSTSFLGLFHYHPDFVVLHVLLPIGISFYTFHGLSYVFDIYNHKAKPSVNVVNYALFVSFFPLLVAGPIERATHLLPQIEQSRKFRYPNAINGLKQILWGLFKKMVIADNCAQYANLIFNHSDKYAYGTLIFGALMFAFQIYGDFSGYSDIALGTARLFGFELLKNFNYPYFSRSIAEFWRRWHISLSSWFKDYLYVPLGGSRGSTWARIRNTLIIFLVSGLWHGANWTFICWGGLNALFIIPSIINNSNRKHLNIVAEERYFPSLKELLQIGCTFSLTVFAWIFFRADSIAHALMFIRRILTLQPGSGRPTLGLSALPLLILFSFITEWSQRNNHFALDKLGAGWPRLFRWGFYAIIVFCLGMYTQTERTQFIYFQF